MSDRPAPRRALPRRTPWLWIISAIVAVVLIAAAAISYPYFTDSVGTPEQKAPISRAVLPNLAKKPEKKWSLDYSKLIEASGTEPIVLDPQSQNLLLLVSPGKNGQVSLLDSQGGEVKHQTSIPNLVACADSILTGAAVCISGDQAKRISTSDGSVLNSFPVPAEAQDVAIHDGAIFVVSYPARSAGSEGPATFARFRTDGQQDWTQTVKLAATSPKPYLNYRFTPSLLVSGAIATDGTPIALSLSDGTAKTLSSARSAIVLPDGDFALAKDNGVAVLSGTGETRFELRGAEQPFASWDKTPAGLPKLMAVDAAGVSALTGLSNQGRSHWSVPGYATTAAYCEDKILAWNVDHDTIGAINPKNGELRWQTHVANSQAKPGYCAGSTFVVDGIEGQKPAVVGLSLADGTQNWSLTPAGDWRLLPSSVGILIATRDSLTLYA